MKINQITFLLIILGLIFWVARTTPERRIQAQESAPPEIHSIGKLTFRVVMEIESENDRPVADILWFQKAAEVAIKHKIPWFNVLEEKISQRHVEGVIQLVQDPMKAEYDANEILSLHLTNEGEE